MVTSFHITPTLASSIRQQSRQIEQYISRRQSYLMNDQQTHDREIGSAEASRQDTLLAK